MKTLYKSDDGKHLYKYEYHTAVIYTDYISSCDTDFWPVFRDPSATAATVAIKPSDVDNLYNFLNCPISMDNKIKPGKVSYICLTDFINQWDTADGILYTGFHCVKLYDTTCKPEESITTIYIRTTDYQIIPMDELIL